MKRSELSSLLAILEQEAARRDRPAIWTPLPGPQTAALESEADVLLYGGAAGGGKTDLLIGAASTRHERSIIYRREFPQLKAIRDRAREILGDHGTWAAREEEWRLYDGRRIELGAVALPDSVSKYQGRPHDFIGFDEIPGFLESQFRFLIGWKRSTNPRQRVRVICAGNPPTTAEGDWVNRYWGPWLDKKHPNPAAIGELRWFATINGKDVEVDGPEPIKIDGEPDPVLPESRTFIRARVQDNPFYMASGYLKTLQALPEPLRSKMLLGDYEAGQEDDPWQVIPTDWITAAQERWTADGGDGRPVDALGVDVSRGGGDRTVLTPRRGTWFGEQVVHSGSATPDGPAALRHIIACLPAGQAPMVQIDVIGVGASVFDMARDRDLNAIALNGAQKSTGRDRSGTLGFANRRAEWYWRLREALDPETGEGLALPPDPELRADLTAPRWSTRSEGIQVEPKPDIAKRIGRSPDKGDSLVYAHAQAADGIFAYYRESAAAVEKAAADPSLVAMRAPDGMSTVYTRDGRKLVVGDDRIVRVTKEDAAGLRSAGFIDA